MDTWPFGFLAIWIPGHLDSRPFGFLAIRGLLAIWDCWPFWISGRSVLPAVRYFWPFGISGCSVLLAVQIPGHSGFLAILDSWPFWIPDHRDSGLLAIRDSGRSDSRIIRLPVIRLFAATDSCTWALSPLKSNVSWLFLKRDSFLSYDSTLMYAFNLSYYIQIVCSEYPQCQMMPNEQAQDTNHCLECQ